MMSICHSCNEGIVCSLFWNLKMFVQAVVQWKLLRFLEPFFRIHSNIFLSKSWSISRWPTVILLWFQYKSHVTGNCLLISRTNCYWHLFMHIILVRFCLSPWNIALRFYWSLNTTVDIWLVVAFFNTLRKKKYDRHLADANLKWIFPLKCCNLINFPDIYSQGYN